jgi:replicative DNA helicase
LSIEGLQITKVDAKKEERVLLACIMSTDFMNHIRKIMDFSLFTSKATKIVAQWCAQYYDTYGCAPQNQLTTIFDNSELSIGETDREYIGALLAKISTMSSEEHEFNIDYQVDQTIEFFKSRRLEKLVSKVQNELMVGKLDTAENAVVQYMKVEKEANTGIDLFRDKDRIKVMSTDKRHTLFQPPGAVGELTGPFKRGDFVMFASKGKSGKSTMLQQLGIWAVLGASLKVLHVTLEMPEDEVKDKYYSAFTGKMLSMYRGESKITYPYLDGEGYIQYADIDGEMMTAEDIVESSYDLNMMSKGGRLFVESRPENSFSVKDLKMLLDKYETQQNLVFDVVIVDYADIMIPQDSKLEYRHRLDEIYKSLRGLAQERSLLIATATQSSRESFKKDTSATNISEDIRKLATVTHAFAINMTDEEKAKKYWRLSTIVSRRQFFLEQDTVVCLACLDVARMVVDSRWANEVHIGG